MNENPPPSIMSRRTPIAILIGLTLLSGVVHGVLDGRWTAAKDLVAQGEVIDQLPEKFGDWKLIDSPGLEEGAAAILRCYGSTNRVYENEQTGAIVNVALMFGPRGPIAVHTPEVCYSSVGTEQMADRKAESISTVKTKHELWSVPFSRKDSGEEFEVWYGWSDGDQWQAAKHPRFWATSTLYKLQLSGPAGSGDDRPCEDFLNEFLPETEKVVKPM